MDYGVKVVTGLIAASGLIIEARKELAASPVNKNYPESYPVSVLKNSGHISHEPNGNTGSFAV